MLRPRPQMISSLLSACISSAVDPQTLRTTEIIENIIDAGNLSDAEAALASFPHIAKRRCRTKEPRYAYIAHTWLCDAKIIKNYLQREACEETEIISRK